MDANILRSLVILQFLELSLLGLINVVLVVLQTFLAATLRYYTAFFLLPLRSSDISANLNSSTFPENFFSAVLLANVHWSEAK